MAIAFDATAKSTGGAVSSFSYSHTCSGNDRFLVVGVVTVRTNAATLTGITYNGVAMTSLYNYQHPNISSRIISWFYLYAPATGTNTITVTYSTAIDLFAASVSASYTGVLQSGFPNANNKTDGTGTHTSTTVSVTTTVNNCWLLGLYYDQEAGTISAGSNTTLRNTQQDAGSDQAAAFDSNSAITPAGSASLTANITSQPNTYSLLVAAIAPSSSGNFFMFF